MQLSPRIRNTLFGFLIAPLTYLASATPSHLTELQQLVPMTSEAVDSYLEKAEMDVLQTLNHLASIPDEQKTVETMMRPWNRLSNELLDQFRLLTYLANSPFSSNMAAGIAIEKYQGFLFQALIQNSDLFRSLMAYAKHTVTNGSLFSPYEHYEVECLLKSCGDIKASLAQSDQDALDELQSLNSKYEKTPYIYLKSKTPEKTSDASYPKDGLSVLTLNTCFMPGNYPFLFGGVYMPWQKRVSLLGEKLRSVNADVVCLQEIFAEETTYALFEELKDTYTYFYGAIGPRFLGFSFDTFGFPSGLFIASKYPIENPQFTLFSVAGFPMNYGCFDFVVKNGDTSIGHVYTTHLQPLDYEEFDQIRASQLNQILEKMESDLAKDENVPMFLCGDLNVPYGSDEPSEALIRGHFYDDYNRNIPATITKANSTCTDYFTNYLFAGGENLEEIDPNFQILDYALLLRPSHSSRLSSSRQAYTLNTVLVPANDLKDPDAAISDHHALLSIIQRR
jgi:endonuclease/exonuclease/phosphatase family metal-dependent hydrolase